MTSVTGYKTEQYLDLAGHQVRSGSEVKVEGSDVTWTVGTLGPVVNVKRGMPRWTVTKVVS